MAFHNKQTDGSMVQKTIHTVIEASNIQKGIDSHDKAVSDFNSKHNVFFNQIVPTIRLDATTILAQTVCLYADGVK